MCKLSMFSGPSKREPNLRRVREVDALMPVAGQTWKPIALGTANNPTEASKRANLLVAKVCSAGPETLDAYIEAASSLLPYSACSPEWHEHFHDVDVTTLATGLQDITYCTVIFGHYPRLPGRYTAKLYRASVRATLWEATYVLKLPDHELTISAANFHLNGVGEKAFLSLTALATAPAECKDVYYEEGIADILIPCTRRLLDRLPARMRARRLRT